ncbi:MAG: zf-HC2 domain-containing protein [Acidobacteriota bacterium]|nr:zf-HC2 domain-containing protein [Acidobacteriota bacterium]
MGCSTVDLKAYALGETDSREKGSVEGHVAACADCREELDRLRFTHTALASLPDEEVPQRIAFVSDKVFEPRWWQLLWRSGPAMGFASAALVACAILAHGWMRPVVVNSTGVDQAKIEQRIQDEVARRVDSAVARSVAASEQRQSQETARMLAAAEKRYDFQRRSDLMAAQETVKYYAKQMGRLMVASNDAGGSEVRQ